MIRFRTNLYLRQCIFTRGPKRRVAPYCHSLRIADELHVNVLVENTSSLRDENRVSGELYEIRGPAEK